MHAKNLFEQYRTNIPPTRNRAAKLENLFGASSYRSVGRSVPLSLSERPFLHSITPNARRIAHKHSISTVAFIPARSRVKKDWAYN